MKEYLYVPLQNLGRPDDGSGDESDYEYNPGESLLDGYQTPVKRVSNPFFPPGYVGQFFFRHSIGMRIYIALLAIALGGLEAGTSVLNRVIFITGVWRFSYPITITFAQVLATHVLLMLVANTTRVLRQPLSWAGLQDVVAPPVRRLLSPWSLVTLGAFDLNLSVTLRVLPLAVVFVAKLFFSNLAFAYASLSKYTLSKLPVIPLIFLLTPFIYHPKATYTKSLIFSSLITLIGLLLICLNQRTPDATTDTLVYGLLSSFFAALYALLLLRTHTALTNLAETTSTYDHDAPTPAQTTYTMLMHLSALTVILMAPILLWSQEIQHISKYSYILDVPKFWSCPIGSFFTTFGVFVATPLLTRSAGPLVPAVVGVVRSGILVLVLEGKAKWIGWLLWISGAVGFMFAHAGRRWS